MSTRHNTAEIAADLPRRHVLKSAASLVAMSFVEPSFAAAERDVGPVNLASVAKPAALYVSDNTTLADLNSGIDPVTVNPAQARRFSVRVRVPQRKSSELYSAVPEVGGLVRLAVNGEAMTPVIENGYAVITREWRRGNRIELELPMAVQRVTADGRIDAARGKVAVRYDPLVYNVERIDQARIDQPLSAAPLKAGWRPNLLGDVTVVRGTWADGTPMLAIPNFARANREGEGIPEFPGEQAAVN